MSSIPRLLCAALGSSCVIALAACPAADERAVTPVAYAVPEAPPAMDTSFVPAAIPVGQIVVSNGVGPIKASTNTLPAGMAHRDGYLTEGFAEFGPPASNVARLLRIKGVSELPGTKSVMLDVSRGAAADIFAAGVQALVLPADAIGLQDDRGRTYSPIGYIHEKGDGRVDVRLAPGRYLRSFDDLPYLPTSGTQKLRLYFRVTQGVTITGLRYGPVNVASCELVVD